MIFPKKFSTHIERDQLLPAALATLAALAAGVIGFYVLGLQPKWAVYIFSAPVIAVSLHKLNSDALKISAFVFVLVFFESVLVFRRAFPNDPNYFPRLVVGASFVFMVVLLISYLFKLRRPRLSRVYVLAWLAFLCFSAVSLVISLYGHPGPYEIEINIFQTYYLEFFACFFLGSIAFNDPKGLGRFYTLLVIVGGIVAATHLLSIAYGFNLETIRGAEVATYRDLTKDVVWRYGGVFGNPNTMSAFYVMLLPAAIFLLFNRVNYLAAPFLVASTILMTVSLMSSGSRAGLLFLGVNLLVLFFAGGVTLKRAIVPLGIVLLVGTASYQLIMNHFSTFLDLSFTRMFDRGISDIRYILWFHSLQIIWNNPFGIGLDWNAFFNELFKYGGFGINNPHNVYLSIAVNNGILTLVAYLVIIMTPIVRFFSMLSVSTQSDERGVIIMTLVMLSGFMLFSLTEPIFLNGFKLHHIFALLLGIANGIHGWTGRDSEVENHSKK